MVATPAPWVCPAPYQRQTSFDAKIEKSLRSPSPFLDGPYRTEERCDFKSSLEGFTARDAAFFRIIDLRRAHYCLEDELEPTAATGNFMLDSLPQGDRACLLERGRLEGMPLKRILFDPGEAISTVFFPVQGVVSMISLMVDGGVVEVATVGREGVVGVPAVLDRDRKSNLQTISQVPGQAISVGADVFREEIAKGGGLAQRTHEYVGALFTFIGQNVACNRLHTHVQRCARWLLSTHDRVDVDRFSLTQEFLAQMLGARRASVTQAASALQDLGAIRYNRGEIVVVDRELLEAQACECYGVTARAFAQLYGGSLN